MKQNRNAPPIQKKPTFKERLSALSNLPAFFKLVWKSSPKKTFFSFFFRILRSAMPVALLYVGKLIVDEVVLLNSNNQIHDATYLWKLVALEFILAIDRKSVV